MTPRRFLIALVALVSTGLSLVAAQQAPHACGAALDVLWAAASSACMGAGPGTICSGGMAPQAEPNGPVSHALASPGAQVDADAVTALRTAPFDAGGNRVGVAWLRVASPLHYTALLIGDVAIRDVTPEGFPRWTSFVLETAPSSTACPSAPANLFVLQSEPGQPTRVMINGVSIALDGTVAARTVDARTVLVALSGESAVQAPGASQALVAGQQLSVPHHPGGDTGPPEAASAPGPYDPTALHDLPVALLPRPFALPQPGYAVTGANINLRAGPSTSAGIITLVPEGEYLSVLGQDPTGEWYHVRRDHGETGWMLAELLDNHLGPVEAVYATTPLPPRPYGEVGSNGRVLAPAGVALRTGPDAGFPSLGQVGEGAVVALVERSPYSPWVKVEANGTIGWVALIALDTQANFEALPVDADVPPPPPPTRVPGSFGNAFPDPNLNP